MTDSVLIPPVVETNTNFALLLGTIDLGSDSRQMLLTMVNNASITQYSFTEYDFSEPAKPIEDAPIRNTLIRLLPKSTSGQYGSKTIYYNRIHISVLGDIRIFKNGATLVSEIIPYINTTYGINLTSNDYVDAPLPASSTTDEVSVVLTIKPACMEFYGGTKIVLALPETITVDRAHIGLINVDNTSDIAKPVSTAQAQANANTLASANAYTDNKTASLTVSILAAAVSKDDITLADAKEYADSKIASSIASNNTSNTVNSSLILAQAALAAAAKDTVILNTATSGWIAADGQVLAGAASAAALADATTLNAARSFATAADASILAQANAATQTAVAQVTGNIGEAVLNQAKAEDVLKLQEARVGWKADDVLLHAIISSDISQSASQTLTAAGYADITVLASANTHADTAIAAALVSLDFASIAIGDAATLSTAKAFAISADTVLLSTVQSVIQAGDAASVIAATTAAQATVTAALVGLPTAQGNADAIALALVAASAAATVKDSILTSQYTSADVTNLTTAKDFTTSSIALALADVGAPSLAQAIAADAVVLAAAKADSATKDAVILGAANTYANDILTTANTFTTSSIADALASLDSPQAVTDAVAAGVATAEAYAVTKDTIVLSNAIAADVLRLQDAKDYADTQIAINLANIEAPIISAADSNATAKDTVILNNAKAFATAADTALHATITTEWTAADTNISTTAATNTAAALLNAKTYADNKDIALHTAINLESAANLTEAKAYTDTKVAAAGGAATTVLNSLLGTWPGITITATGSLRYYPPIATTIGALSVWAGNPSSGNTTISLYKNNILILTATLISGNSEPVTVTGTIVLAITDFLTIDLVSNGTIDVSARVDFK